MPRFAIVVDAELTSRNSRRINRLLKDSNMRDRLACVEDIDYKTSRGLERSAMASLILCDWIRTGLNLLLTGPTGTGKTWLACALGNHACRKNLSVKFFRASLLLEELAISHADGSFRQKLSQLAKVDLLILDDFGTTALNAVGRNDLLEVIEQRCGSKSTVLTSQLPANRWHDYLADGNPTVADAILDRLQGGSQRIELKGESLRRTRAKKAIE
jgi:DNA replication protein DnaC